MKKKTIQIFPNIKFLKNLQIDTIKAGIKSKLKEDIAIVSFKELANVASVFTKSKTCAPNITWLKKIKNNEKAKALYINSGNANAYTGKNGYQNVIRIAKHLADIFDCKKENIIISSTGVIGEQLPIEKILNSFSKLSNKKSQNTQNWLSLAKAIMTTDTFPKGYYKEININNKKYNIVGICKGSGMIAPNMATMLAFIFTDLQIPSKQLKVSLKDAVEESFNKITVDGDTSTNDMVSIFSLKKNKEKTFLDKKNLKKFQENLNDVAIQLAKKIVLDGEGAKKLIEIEVFGAKNNLQAKNVALSVANSLLVKTAIAGEDANWGRIIMAIGKSSAIIDQKKISIQIGGFLIIDKGEINKNYIEKKLSKYLKSHEITINIDLCLGPGNSKVWTCDLTKKYIEINADYRS
mgnify:FL=1